MKGVHLIKLILVLMDNEGKYKGFNDLKAIRLCLGMIADTVEMKILLKTSIRKPSERIEEEWINCQKAMRIMHITRGTLQSLRDNGTLPYSTVGGKFYYKASDVEALLQSNYTKRPRKEKKHQGTYY